MALLVDNSRLPLTFAKLCSQTNDLRFASESRDTVTHRLERPPFVHEFLRSSFNGSSECVEIAHCVVWLSFNIGAFQTIVQITVYRNAMPQKQIAIIMVKRE